MTREERAALKEVAEMKCEYLSILEGTEDTKITELLYEDYINCEPAFLTSQEADVGKISRALDDKTESGGVTTEELAHYEEAARRAGFYAGFKAGIAYARFLRRINERINDSTTPGMVIETPCELAVGQNCRGEGDKEARNIHDHVISRIACLNIEGLARVDSYISGLTSGGDYMR